MVLRHSQGDLSIPNLREADLYGPVTDHLLRRGYFVFSRAPKPGVNGTSEFGVKAPGSKKYQAIDVLGVKWTSDRDIHTVAVECKLHSTARQSVGASLDQATDYQVTFDEVYIATQKGELKDREPVLSALGIGHLAVDPRRQRCSVTIEAQVRVRSRFNSR